MLSKIPFTIIIIAKFKNTLKTGQVHACVHWAGPFPTCTSPFVINDQTLA